MARVFCAYPINALLPSKTFLHTRRFLYVILTLGVKKVRGQEEAAF